MYGANATPWTVATSLKRTAIVSPLYHGGTESYGDLWDVANAIEWTLTLDSISSMTFRRIQRLNGVPQVQALLAIPVPGPTTPFTYTSWNVLPVVVSAVALSPTAVRFIVSGTGYGTNAGGATGVGSGFTCSYIVTWDGVSTPSQVNTFFSAGAGYYKTGYGNRRGYLLGSTSCFVQVNTSYGGAGSTQNFAWPYTANLYDRGNSNTFAPLGTFGFSDWLGGGYRVVAAPTKIPSDANNRVTVSLEQWGDQGVNSLAFIRLTGYTYTSILGTYALSGTLVAVQFKDANSSIYIALFSVDVSKPAPLGPMGIYNSGYLGGAAFLSASPAVNYDAKNVYLWRVTNALACKLSRVNYNEAAQAGLELTCLAGNDVTVTLGNGVPGITGATVMAAWQCAPDTLAVLYAATATTAAVYIEVFALT